MPTELNYKSFFTEDDADLPQEFWGDEGAGALFIAKDTGRILVFLRSGKVNEPGTWNLVGGRIDSGEDPKGAVERVVEEETGYTGNFKASLIYTFHRGNFKYYNYVVIVPFEFTPELNWEHSTSKWIEYGDWPQPLHFGLNDVIKHAGHKIKRIVDLVKNKNKGIKKESIDSPPAHIQPVPKQTVPIPPKMEDAYIVAATLWGEARGEGEIGMHAVLNVIMNRANGDIRKAKNIVLRPKQFSIWNGVENPEQIAINLAQSQREKKIKDGPSYLKAIELVDKAMRGHLPDITNGAKYYFNPRKANPVWAKAMIKTKSIGNHDFYKSPGKSLKKEEINYGENKYTLFKQGLVDDGIYGYEIKSPYSYLRYGYEPSSRIFYLYNIGTPSEENRNKGYAKGILEHFFQIIKEARGSLDTGPYTTSGNAYIKHVVERLSKQYGVRLVQGNQ